MVWNELKGEVWSPEEEGEAVEGVIIDKAEGQWGITCTIENKESGINIKTPAHTILQERLEKCNIGDRVRIEYKGSKDSKKGNPVQIYKVFKWEE